MAVKRLGMRFDGALVHQVGASVWVRGAQQGVKKDTKEGMQAGRWGCVTQVNPVPIKTAKKIRQG